jgi:primosomal protein N''
LANYLAERDPACRQAARRRPLNDRFDLHLLECDGCENYLQQFRSAVATVGKIPIEELDPALRSRLVEAFKDWR